MRMNQGVEWAVHACTVLATLGPERALSAAALAEYHGVPAPYMAKQLQLLSKAGIVRTARGKTGGYTLARPAAQITLWQIARAVDGSLPMFRCSEIRQRGPCAARREDCRKPCGIAAVFAAAEDAYRAALDAVSLEDLVVQFVAVTSPQKLRQSAEWLASQMTSLPTV